MYNQLWVIFHSCLTTHRMARVKLGETVQDSAENSTVVALVGVVLGRSHVRTGVTVENCANVRRYQRWRSKEGTRTVGVLLYAF